jgi:hypothetical protein
MAFEINDKKQISNFIQYVIEALPLGTAVFK